MNDRHMRNETAELIVPEEKLQKATLGMGCFWSPDALFGHLPGVIRTKTGYAGGTAEQPTYRDMGDHSETVELEFDPAVITFEDVLDVFWDHHNPVNINGYKGRQYMSLILCHNGEQQEAVQAVISRRKKQGSTKTETETETEVAPCPVFYPAEERHQKYYLKRFPDAVYKLGKLYPSHRELVNSTLAARLNGLAKGYTSLERVAGEIKEWPMEPAARQKVLDLIRQIRW
ncbi:peptide-methionine (S)-S-oxide reductase MsrA [Paenibacillus sp. UNC499MF]|uniref:peptide-methionine (S)-S-oxide reductase MsrA n=1 Tax=Paenibacillus sp. UNC499MF TaxID=1502751 RepID=UPI0008A0383D|nr:peptide-methionine (S)-S-oxide reductase MsrA [Paenibacillus sp. UNC499MF]SEG57642.1 peptide-methionine (S)-S-oxide reductase [Paenibacillus sp. UNC499MF]